MNKYVDKNSILKFLEKQIIDCILTQKETDKKSIDFIRAQQSKFTYIYLKQEIERGEFDAD